MRVGLKIAALTLAAGLALVACGGYGGGKPTPSPLPSGSLGPVTLGAAAAAVQGLCGIVAATDHTVASTAFYDRTHDELHVVAAATEERDRGVAATLLESMQKVESDLAATALPARFGNDVDALLAATRGALTTIGLDAPACG